MTEQRNEILPRLGSCLDNALVEMIEKTVNNNIQSIIQQTVDQAVERLNENPPEWFTNQISEIKRDVSEIKRDVSELKGDVSEIKRDVSELKGDVSELKRDVSELKGDVSELKRDASELKGDVSELKRDVRVVTAKVDSVFKMSEYRHACLYNMFRRMNGYSAAPVPFLNVVAILDVLPPIASVQDIDSLSKQECQSYLRAYNVEFHPNESVKLKERLRDAIGLGLRYDMEFQFESFH